MKILSFAFCILFFGAITFFVGNTFQSSDVQSTGANSPAIQNYTVKDLPKLKSLVYEEMGSVWIADFDSHNLLINKKKLTVPGEVEVVKSATSIDDTFMFFTAVPFDTRRAPFAPSDLYKLDISARKLITLTHNSLGYDYLQLSPNDKWLVYQSGAANVVGVDWGGNNSVNYNIMNTKSLKHTRIARMSWHYRWRWTPIGNALISSSYILKNSHRNNKWRRLKVNWPTHLKGYKFIDGNYVMIVYPHNNDNQEYTFYSLPKKSDFQHPLKRAKKSLQFIINRGFLETEGVRFKSKIIYNEYVNKIHKTIVIDLTKKSYCSLKSLQPDLDNGLIAHWSKDGKYIIYEVYKSVSKTAEKLDIMAVKVSDLPWISIKYINSGNAQKITAYKIASPVESVFVIKLIEK